MKRIYLGLFEWVVILQLHKIEQCIMEKVTVNIDSLTTEISA